MTTTLQVRVKTGARVSALTPLADGTWLAQTKAQPVDGKANAELIALVAQCFGCRRALVTITHGVGARLKRVQIADG